MGRFINADALISTGQSLVDYNMFTYCDNNPVCQTDENGYLSHKVERDGDSIIITVEHRIMFLPVDHIAVFEIEIDFIDGAKATLGSVEFTLEEDSFSVKMGPIEWNDIPYNSTILIPSEATWSKDIIDETLAVFAEATENGFGIGTEFTSGIVSCSFTVIPVPSIQDAIQATATNPVPVGGGGIGNVGGKSNITGIGGGIPLRNPTMMMCFM